MWLISSLDICHGPPHPCSLLVFSENKSVFSEDWLLTDGGLSLSLSTFAAVFDTLASGPQASPASWSPALLPTGSAWIHLCQCSQGSTPHGQECAKLLAYHHSGKPQPAGPRPVGPSPLTMVPHCLLSLDGAAASSCQNSPPLCKGICTSAVYSGSR